MSTDLTKQREYAESFAEILSEEIGADEVTADMILDLLGCCGLALREGEDAGKAWMDEIIKDAEAMKSKKKKR